MADVLMKGIDISTYQKNVDFNKLKKSGYDFVIIRAGVGRYASQKDDEFENHYKGAKAAGLHVGCYWYSYALTDDTCTLSVQDLAKEEAKAFKEVIQGKQFDMPVYYDLEENKAFQKGAYSMNLLADTFCRQMENYGYWCGIYGGQYLADYLLTQESRNRYAFWLAQYLKNPTYKGQYGMWQFGVAGDGPNNNPTGQTRMTNSYWPGSIKGETEERKAGCTAIVELCNTSGYSFALYPCFPVSGETVSSKTARWYSIASRAPSGSASRILS